MFRPVPALDVARAASLVIVATLGILPVAAGPESPCPPKLDAWRFYGNVEAGGEWTVQALEIRGDIGVLREARIRFGSGGLETDHAPWFDAPTALEPETLLTRTLGFTGDELHAHCLDLSGTQIDNLRKKSRPRCLVDPAGHRKRDSPTQVASRRRSLEARADDSRGQLARFRERSTSMVPR